jgi:hypothetical protein
VRLFALIVTKDEANRYLDAVVRWTHGFVDTVAVFDDRSWDDTREIANKAGALVGMREEGQISFAENESAFRQAAWEFLGNHCQPAQDDWVVCIDADEFLLTITVEDERKALLGAIWAAEEESCSVIDMPVAEVFEMTGRRPLIRTDGQWGQIRAPRIARWQPTPTFRDQKLAGGSLPQIAGPPLRIGDPLLLHAGYRRRADRIEKQNRYSRKGHGAAHVRSITETGIYTPWSHPLPAVIAEALEEDR